MKSQGPTQRRTGKTDGEPAGFEAWWSRQDIKTMNGRRSKYADAFRGGQVSVATDPSILAELRTDTGAQGVTRTD